MGTVAIAARPLITNQTFIGLVPSSDELTADFLYWTLQAQRDRLNATATGAIQQYLSRDDFRQLRLPIPPIGMQRAIADFLDGETARIDALIEKKRRMVELLRERARRLEKAVTLESGLPTVPARWHLKVGSGEGLDSDYLADAGTTPVTGATGLWVTRNCHRLLTSRASLSAESGHTAERSRC